MTGYQSKKAAAQDKLEDDDALTIAYQSGYYDGKKAAQPAQEREALKLALEFVEDVNFGEWQGSTERQEEIITAIKEALENNT